MKVGIVNSEGKTTWSEDKFQKLEDTVSITAPAVGASNIKIANASSRSVDYPIFQDLS